MQYRKGSCFYHPSIVVMVDDSEGFLATIQVIFPQNIPYLTFSDEAQALLTSKSRSDQLNTQFN